MEDKLIDGCGYLYRNTAKLNIEYRGAINSGTVSRYVTVKSDKLTGFTLLGNPYTHNVYKGDGAAIPNMDGKVTLLADGFYTLTKSGAWTAGLDHKTAIKPGQGILVQALEKGTVTMSNTTSAGSKRYNNDMIKFTVANGDFEDITYAMFDNGYGLNKINHRNPDIPMIYINRSGTNYAVAALRDDVKVFNLNVKAPVMGSYTLKMEKTGEFDYLHVYDKLTKRDIDMLADDEYTFVASPSDNDGRFVVYLQYMPDYGKDEFAYQNGDDLFVSGSGDLQVYDVMGRLVMTQHISGVEALRTSSLRTGVYVLRLIGEEIRTQKIFIQ